MRSGWLVAATLLILPLLGSERQGAAEARDSDPPRSQTAAEKGRVRAVRRGIQYLARHQNENGSWGQMDGRIGITSLCLLAFLAQGHQEGRGEFAKQDVLGRGVQFLLRHSLPPSQDNPLLSTSQGRPTGFIYLENDSNSRMHGHGYATQVLVLAYGSARASDERTKQLKLKIQRAVRVIEESQTLTGGWGYEPKRASSHEGSVTVTVVQALRLARDAGFVVDKEVHDRGLKYLMDSQKRDGSFKYALMEDRSTPALTAAALTAMYGFGEYYTRSIRRGLEYISDPYQHPGELEWTFYGNYYAAQAFYRAGGRLWREWEQRGVPWIVQNQIQSDHHTGYWDDRDQGNSPHPNGPSYSTAMAVLALSVPDGYLPLFQK